jgi:hypothetical protein
VPERPVLQVRLALLVLQVRLEPLALLALVALVPLALQVLARAGLLVVRGVACQFPPIFFSVSPTSDYGYNFP